MNEYHVLCQITARNYEAGTFIPFSEEDDFFHTSPSTLTSLPLADCLKRSDEDCYDVVQNFTGYTFQFVSASPYNYLEESLFEMGAIETFEDYREEINEVYQQVISKDPQPFGCAFVVLWRVENYVIDTDWGNDYASAWYLEGLVDMSKIISTVVA